RPVDFVIVEDAVVVPQINGVVVRTVQAVFGVGQRVRHAVNGVGLGADAFQNVNLAVVQVTVDVTGRRLAGIFVVAGQHPDGRPGADFGWHLGGDNRLPIQDFFFMEGNKGGRGVVEAAISVINGA